eukprot:COSAG06_NODE_48453_length_332_cov_0.652361_2_plen_46_part_01
MKSVLYERACAYRFEWFQGIFVFNIGLVVFRCFFALPELPPNIAGG